MCKQMLMHVVNVSSAFITLYSLNQGFLVESASGLACWALTQEPRIWIALTQVISPTPGYCFYCFKASWLILFWMVAHQVSWVFRFVIASLLWLLHSINTEYFWWDCKLSTLGLSSKLRGVSSLYSSSLTPAVTPTWSLLRDLNSRLLEFLAILRSLLPSDSFYHLTFLFFLSFWWIHLSCFNALRFIFILLPLLIGYFLLLSIIHRSFLIILCLHTITFRL